MVNLVNLPMILSDKSNCPCVHVQLFNQCHFHKMLSNLWRKMSYQHEEEIITPHTYSCDKLEHIFETTVVIALQRFTKRDESQIRENNWSLKETMTLLTS